MCAIRNTKQENIRLKKYLFIRSMKINQLESTTEEIECSVQGKPITEQKKTLGVVFGTATQC